MLEPGVYPASVTPMTPEGQVDTPSLARILAHFKAAGCKGAVLAGTNGEGPSLSAVEKRDLIRVAVPLFPELKIIAGIATPSLDEAIWLASQAHKAGASAGLVMAPGYFREASVEGIARWFESLMDKTELPMLIYNFPQRTGIELTPELMARLSNHPRMIGLKDSSGNEANISGYASVLKEKNMFVGNETLLWKALEAGWTGTISGAANCIPHWLVVVVEGWFGGKKESAQAKFQIALRGIEALRGVPQPATNKAVLHKTGVLPSPAVRLPLEGIPDESLQTAMDRLGDLLS